VRRIGAGRASGPWVEQGGCYNGEVVLLDLLLLIAPGLPVTAATGDLARDAREVLARQCFACHGPDEEAREAGLRLDELQAALEGGRSGPALIPGEPEASLLLQRVTDPVDPMPPRSAGHAPSAEEVEILRSWIAAGAPAAQHWSFVTPTRPDLPAEGADPWVLEPLDAFVLQRLRAAGLEPAPMASREVFARRSSLDLRGVPPTLAELDAFLADREPGAEERWVDRLLADPAYGERWAAVWLDLARYADSKGHGSDPLRTIWPYRDWVIDALNRNLPYDQFSIEQLAGDLLPDADDQTRLATAFHRNTMTNTEGGTDNEEFRVLAVKDRTATTWSVWMGLTMGCAECHTHKFDPITHADYYSSYAVFDQTVDRDNDDDRPRLAVPNRATEEERQRLEAERSALLREQEQLRPAEALLAALTERQAALDRSWAPARITEARSAGGATCAVDGATVRMGGESPERDHTLLRLDARAVTGLRLEVLRDEGAPSGGPGRAPGNGNIVLNHLVTRWSPAAPAPLAARFVRVELPGPKRILSLAEVEVLTGGVNRALGRPVRQSSVDFGGPPERAVDGEVDGRFESGSTTHTRTEDDPWWEVDLGEMLPVEAVRLHNRVDGRLEERLAGAVLVLLDEQRQVAFRQVVEPLPEPSTELRPGQEPARLVAAHASADFSQKDWRIEFAIDHRTEGASGWGLSPRLGRDHAAVFDLGFQVPPGTWEVELWQDYGSWHTIGALRLATTATASPRELAPELAQALRGEAPLEGALREEALSLARSSDPELVAMRPAFERLDSALAALPLVETPVMVALPTEEQRVTRILRKGNFLDPAEPVAAAIPAAFRREGAPSAPDRLALARWLFSEGNPLTARVHANRLWARLFGTGLVETEEDFGSQGARPSHPELLDWLAVEFRESGWDQKALLRRLVLSATYRQRAESQPEALALDPAGRLLAGKPRVRLEAEMVRDQALAVAGLLTEKLYGPPVFPPQPDGLWQAAFNGQRSWETDTDEDRFRRGVYVFLRRTSPYPMLETFDATSRERCTLRRVPTNTPLQAFVTLNDPAFHEAAQGLARRVLAEAATPDAARLRHGWRLATCREPEPEELATLQVLLEGERERFARVPDQARQYAAPADSVLGPAPAGVVAHELAAWTSVASVLLNLDEVLVR
jgi:mono/diheme cytochrome c family protein